MMDLTKILAGLLVNFMKEKDNIKGTIALLRTDKQKEQMIDWILKNQNNNLNTDKIITQALKIAHLEK